MRDYIVVWNRQDTDDNHTLRWTADDPGTIGDPDADLYLPSLKTYVRIPNQNLLLGFLNWGISNPSSNYVAINGFHRSFAEAWSNFFGGNQNHGGGYKKLSDVPTSDAYDAIHGRPPRDSQGRFIRQPY